MRRPPVPLIVWALLLATLCGLIAVFTTDLIMYELLGSAAALVVVIAIAVALTAPRAGAGRARLAVAPRVAVPDVSYATTLLALAVSAIALGFAVGPWLTYIGGGLAALATGGLVRELRAQRRVQRLARAATTRGSESRATPTRRRGPGPDQGAPQR